MNVQLLHYIVLIYQKKQKPLGKMDEAGVGRKM